MSRPLAAKDGGACPSMFSTPGSPARFARESVNAFGNPAAVARMSLSPPSSTSASPSGDEDAAERIRVQELYREHSSSLVRQLTRRTGCRELARELANETFVRLLRMRPGKLGRMERPEAFLRHVSINLLRDWGRTTALKQRSQPTLELASDQHLDGVAALESRDTLRRLEIAVGKLKPKTREIFLAHRIHGFTYAEIADRTGLTVKGVEKQMSKAIAKIDRLLDRG